MCVLSRSNCAELEAMVRFADRLGVYVLFQPYHANKTGNPAPEPDSIVWRAEQALHLRKKAGNMMNSRSYLSGIERFLAQAGGKPCHAGFKYFSIDPFGYIHPCVDSPAVGHLLRDEITVLRSQRARQMVNACRGCWYCFRGEADTSFSLTGCLEKARLAIAVLRRNAQARRRG